jgi:disulfide bond formation protein DsbB
MDATQLNYLLAVGTIGLQLFIVVCLIAFWQRENVFVKKTLSVCGDYILPAAFLFALGGSALTLFYSEVVGYLPCGLCWMQRVFLYPQVIILGIAIWKKHTVAADYIIALSVFGALVAGYQYYLQMGGASFLPCPASGVSDCARRYIFEFGYITFPFMSLISFITMGVLMYAYKLRS